jgi:hypothetical protein
LSVVKQRSISYDTPLQMSSTSDIDVLLQSYLGGTEAEAGEAAATTSSDPHVKPSSDVLPSEVTPSKAPSAEIKPSKVTPSMAMADKELQQMLSRYLDTASGVAPEERDFSLPRNTEVDELLRRYTLDNEDVSDRLASSLREHLRRQPADRAPTPQPSPRVSSSQWTRVTASKIEGSRDLDERMQSYAHAYAEQDEQAHTFTSADDSTIKGIPPPNAPPIPLGSPLAKEIKRSLTPPTGVAEKERRTKKDRR